MATRKITTPIGQKFHRLTVLSDAVRAGTHVRYLNVRCDCGVEKVAKFHDVIQGRIKSCGCQRYLNNPDLEIGARYGKLVVTGPFRSDASGRIVTCLCDCGVTCEKRASSLRKAGRTTSCGCSIGAGRRTHGYTTKSQKVKRATYDAWSAMHKRCTAQDLPSWKNYGGRGITVCERWNSFESFLADMGDCPVGKSLDRIRVNEGYSPDNCRWADDFEQMNNTTRNRFLEFDGRSMTMSQWERLLGFRQGTLSQRIVAMGWPIERALTTPLQIKTRK